jgi:DNA-binding XRE family transcriptional regulator
MTAKKPASPIGSTAEQGSLRRAARSPEYRALRAEKGPYREVAWLLIHYRAAHGMTQDQLAKKVGTSYSQISRIESGRQKTSLDMLQRVAHALDLKLVVGFESTAVADAGQRQVVAI